MTQGSTASHTVAYLWKPVKPQWQTVWNAGLRSGEGAWGKAWLRQSAEQEVSTFGAAG